MDRISLDDTAVVAAMAAGDPAGLDSAYRRYADRLHAYARSIVGDYDAASDVVQETFLLAQERVRQLRDPSRLGSWLYTIARNECLRRIRARKRTVTLADSHEPVLDTDPGRAIHAAQVREVVHAAAGGLNDGDREVFELTVRHGLSAAEIAGVLGLSPKHAHARISRARTQFEGALGALLLARDDRGRCASLDSMLLGWDGRLTVLLRKRIERHARDCAVCASRRRDRMNPSSLLAAYGTLPFLAVALHTMPSVTAAETPPGARVPGRTQRSNGRRTAAVAAGVVAFIASAITGVQLARSDPDLVGAEPSAPPTVAISAPPRQDLAAPDNRVSASPDPTPGPATTAPTTAPTISPQGTYVFVVPFTAQASARTTCGASSFGLVVGVETGGATLASARLYWRTSVTTSTAMTVTGSAARRTVYLNVQHVTWWVVATATDGRSATTPEVTTVKTCP
jgi:RNA polymerase sigma factor (sigma-70 family)